MKEVASRILRRMTHLCVDSAFERWHALLVQAKRERYVVGRVVQRLLNSLVAHSST